MVACKRLRFVLLMAVFISLAWSSSVRGAEPDEGHQRQKPKGKAEAPVAPTEIEQDIKLLKEQVEALTRGKGDDEKRISDLEVILLEQQARLKVLQDSEDKKKQDKKKKEGAGYSGWYSASFSTSFGKKDPVNFSFNEVELDVVGKAADWIEFRADLQVRPESADPEEHREIADPMLVDTGDQGLTGVYLLDHVAEQGYAKFTFWKPWEFTAELGKFNSNFAKEAFDAVENGFLTHSLTFLHGVVQQLAGAKVGISPVPQLRIELFAAQGWNQNIDDNRLPSFGGQVRVNIDGLLEAGLAGYYGQEEFFLSGQVQNVPRIAINAHAKLTPVDALAITLEGAWGQQIITEGKGTATAKDITSRWYSGYLTVDFEPISWFDLGLRYELFKDVQGAVLPNLLFKTGGLVHGPSLAARVRLAEKVLFALEANGKFSDEKVLTNPDNKLGKYELFLGAQLYFKFGEGQEEVGRNLTEALGVKKKKE
jgi:hypothetical protein